MTVRVFVREVFVGVLFKCSVDRVLGLVRLMHVGSPCCVLLCIMPAPVWRIRLCLSPSLEVVCVRGLAPSVQELACRVARSA